MELSLGLGSAWLVLTKRRLSIPKALVRIMFWPSIFNCDDVMRMLRFMGARLDVQIEKLSYGISVAVSFPSVATKTRANKAAGTGGRRSSCRRAPA
jgi:hypothetical protein